jgi:hypothetical protein
MDVKAVAEAALFGQLLPNVLSKQEACLFGARKADYFVARDAFLQAWYHNPTEYLSFKKCMLKKELANVSSDLAWRAYCFLCKNGHINTGLVAARASHSRACQDALEEQPMRAVCSVPVRTEEAVLAFACSSHILHGCVGISNVTTHPAHISIVLGYSSSFL